MPASVTDRPRPEQIVPPAAEEIAPEDMDVAANVEIEYVIANKNSSTVIAQPQSRRQP